MNPQLALIFARRSVRQYVPGKDVPEPIVRDLLQAAMAAPSACGKDPWHFVVIRDRAVLARLAAGLPNGTMLAQAAVGLVVCGDLQKAHGNLESYLLQDCSAAIENLLLAAAALGLGACWLGVHPREDRLAHVRVTLALPAHVIPVAAIALGWPAEQPPPRTRFSEAAVHREKW